MTFLSDSIGPHANHGRGLAGNGIASGDIRALVQEFPESVTQVWVRSHGDGTYGLHVHPAGGLVLAHRTNENVRYMSGEDTADIWFYTHDSAYGNYNTQTVITDGGYICVGVELNGAGVLVLKGASDPPTEVGFLDLKAIDSENREPTSLAVSSNGHVYVVTEAAIGVDARLYQIDPSGPSIVTNTTVTSNQQGSVVVDDSIPAVYVLDTSGTLKAYDLDLSPIDSWSFPDAQTSYAYDCMEARDGVIAIAHTVDPQLRVFNSADLTQKWTATLPDSGSGVDIDAAGHIYVSVSEGVTTGHVIRRYSPDGDLVWETQADDSGTIKPITTLGIDPATGRVFAGDHNETEVFAFDQVEP